MTSANESHDQRLPLLQYARNVTSQFGEDGIIEEIFRRIAPRTKTCIEFGAWDGKHLSNTYHLWQNQGWRALLIEGDPERCNQLLQRTAGNAMVAVVNAFVMPSGENSLESLIRRTGFEENADLVCIDIDGDDYHILCSLKDCRPRVLVVEYNPTIPPDMDLSQMPGGALGSSALAIVRAASSKGYTLACMTDSNCVFVRSDEFHKLKSPKFDLVESFPKKYLSYIVSDYRGNCYLTSQPVYAPKFPMLRLGEILGQWRRRRFSRNGSQTGTDTQPRIMPVQLFSSKDD
jgi:hypothetical protein